MRFEPEHDPDPLRSKIRVIESFEDIKGAQYEHFKRLKEKVSKLMEINLQNHPEEDVVKTYFAFQELRIDSLQQEMKSIYTMLLEMAAEIDRKNEQS